MIDPDNDVCYVSMVHVFVTSDTDNWDSMLYIISDYIVNHLQRIRNGVTQTYDHIILIPHQIH